MAESWAGSCKGIAGVWLVAMLVLSPIPAFAAKTISLAHVPHFPTLADAQKSCGTDTVVWASLRAGVYHRAGSRWFGKTKKGAYFCEAVVKKAGVRASRE